MKLMRIWINDGLLDGCLQRLEVHSHTQFGGAVKALDIVADKKGRGEQPSVAIRPTTVSTYTMGRRRGK